MLVVLFDTQDYHLDGWNGPLYRRETAIKRFNKAFIFTLFRRNPSAHFTDCSIPFLRRFRAFTHRFLKHGNLSEDQNPGRTLRRSDTIGNGPIR